MRSQMPLGIGEFSDSGDLKKKEKTTQMFIYHS